MKKTNLTTITATNLQGIFELYPNVSLRKIAPLIGINYGILLKKSKEPIAGKAYDPNEMNWEAIVSTINRKDERIEAFYEINWQELNEHSNRKGPTLPKNMELFEVGTKVYLRKNNATPYEIVYKTETHIVIILEGTQEPTSWSHSTFLLNGPVFEPRVLTNVEEA